MALSTDTNALALLGASALTVIVGLARLVAWILTVAPKLRCAHTANRSSSSKATLAWSRRLFRDASRFVAPSARCAVVDFLVFECERCGRFDRAVFAHCTEEGVLCDDCFDVF
ncbi:hypothetical protein MJJ09_09965 [Xanthomonas oryzae]|nr:hypothetical protein [Xanthomonas oryzae]WEE91931.1 hypothetical protein MJJ09_09965 [Xanthomonas oryzae]